MAFEAAILESKAKQKLLDHKPEKGREQHITITGPDAAKVAAAMKDIIVAAVSTPIILKHDKDKSSITVRTVVFNEALRALGVEPKVDEAKLGKMGEIKASNKLKPNKPKPRTLRNDDDARDIGGFDTYR